MAFLEDCFSDDALPVVIDDCDKPNDNAFTGAFLTDQKHPITGDPTLLASWTPRLSNTSDGSGTGSGNVANPIRHIHFEDGEMQPVSGNFKKNRRGNVQLIQKSDRSITWKEDNDSDVTYNFYRKFQRGGAVLAYPESEPHIYGGKAGVGNGVGIKATLKTAFGVTPGSNGMAHEWTCSLDWSAEEDPDRFLSPF